MVSNQVNIRLDSSLNIENSLLYDDIKQDSEYSLHLT